VQINVSDSGNGGRQPATADCWRQKTRFPGLSRHFMKFTWRCFRDRTFCRFEFTTSLITTLMILVELSGVCYIFYTRMLLFTFLLSRRCIVSLFHYNLCVLQLASFGKCIVCTKIKLDCSIGIYMVYTNLQPAGRFCGQAAAANSPAAI